MSAKDQPYGVTELPVRRNPDCLFYDRAPFDESQGPFDLEQALIDWGINDDHADDMPANEE